MRRGILPNALLVQSRAAGGCPCCGCRTANRERSRCLRCSVARCSAHGTTPGRGTRKGMTVWRRGPPIRKEPSSRESKWNRRPGCGAASFMTRCWSGIERRVRGSGRRRARLFALLIVALSRPSPRRRGPRLTLVWTPAFAGEVGCWDGAVPMSRAAALCAARRTGRRRGAARKSPQFPATIPRKKRARVDFPWPGLGE